MFATIPSASLFGADGYPVSVQVHCAVGLPGFTMIGLPDTSCREARDRVRSALSSCKVSWPNRRITVNLAPTGMRKGGSGLDLAIAMALLAAIGRVDASEIRGMAFLGELGLDGALRTVPGILPMVAAIDSAMVVVPRASYHEACIVGRHDVRPVSHLAELCQLFLLPEEPPDADPDWRPPPRPPACWPDPPAAQPDEPPSFAVDLAAVRGQGLARRALEVSAAGGHHLLMVGSPGSGKTMLAKRLPTLLPELDAVTALDTTKVHSSAGVPLPNHGLITLPPFRAPHHTASPVAMVGGGASWLHPGEISLAHAGVC